MAIKQIPAELITEVEQYFMADNMFTLGIHLLCKELDLFIESTKEYDHAHLRRTCYTLKSTTILISSRKRAIRLYNVFMRNLYSLLFKVTLKPKNKYIDPRGYIFNRFYCMIVKDVDTMIKLEITHSWTE